MSNAPLMPKATAIWLVENTSLTFNQIAAFCKLHPLEVKGIADGEVGAGIRGHDPITSGQLTREEIAKGEADPEHELKLAISKVRLPEAKPRRGARYTPLSRRQDRPNAILWLLRNHPELKDAQIMRLVGTVTLGLCSQIDLDFEVARAAKERPQQVEDRGQTLVPAEVTTRREPPAPATQAEVFGTAAPAPATQPEPDVNLDSVFAKLKDLKVKED